VTAITEAASVLVTRHPGSAEVFLVHRSPSLRFMPGFVAFPGGKVHATDAGLADPAGGLTARHVSAVRELFEETGVLIARRLDGSFPTDTDDLPRLRLELIEERITFADLLADRGLRLHSADLTLAGRLVTPPFAPVRFDTTFYVASLPPGQHADVWDGELTEGLWASADSALASWRLGELLLSPPTQSILETIAGRSVAELPQRMRPALEEMDNGGLPPIWFSPGVRMVPLDCRGLPPTTYTNAYLVGTGPVHLLDPGPADPAEQKKLFDILDARPPDSIVLTHHHPDHIGAVAACVGRYRVPVLAHPTTAELLAGKVAVDRFIHDGESLDLGVAPHGRGRWAMTALLTPGHAPGHLAFYQPDYRLLFAGDMVSTLSSMVIHPADGDLALYLDSLRRLMTLDVRLLLPAHGPPTTRSAHTLSEALEHRLVRERQLIEALASGPRTVAELALELYRGSPAPVLKLAEWQIEAGLIKLHREGRAAPAGAGRFRLVPS
jgi:glyoxylase-like metal-dependent hydrolase (beta-lactamase superfamily II)/8-oxo-dGTP pyrophosphatase MutT (NUDIX family)